MNFLMMTIVTVMVLLTISVSGCGQSVQANKTTTHIESWEMTPAGVYIPQYEK